MRIFKRSDQTIGCGECCNGDRCDDKTHRERKSCPYCLGTGNVKCDECGFYKVDILWFSEKLMMCRECYHDKLDDASNHNG